MLASVSAESSEAITATGAMFSVDSSEPDLGYFTDVDDWLEYEEVAEPMEAISSRASSILSPSENSLIRDIA